MSRGNRVRLWRAWKTGYRSVNHRPLAAGLFLEGKVGHIMWEELREVEGRAENWLKYDLDGLSMREAKRASSLCLNMREI